MAQNKGLNELLKWSIENSTKPTGVTSTSDSNGATNPSQHDLSSTTPRNLDPELLAQLLGGPSDAELMQAAISHVLEGDSDTSITLESRLTALDNLEQLVESLDNANLLATLGLWTPLLGLLGHAEPDIRRMAAWCVGTAVQNNAPCQERLVALGGVERLVALALGESVPFFVDDAGANATTTNTTTTTTATTPANATEANGEEKKQKEKEVRRKAVSALSSAVRNYQPALDVCARELRRKGEPVAVEDSIDATDMDAVNALIDGLRQKALNA